jgi:CBS domain-containing protein
MALSMTSPSRANPARALRVLGTCLAIPAVHHRQRLGQGTLRRGTGGTMYTIRDLLEAKGSVVHSISAEATVQAAVVEMCRLKVGALVVLEQDRTPTGIISERDLLVRVLLKRRDPITTKVAEVMTRNLVSVEPGCTIHGAMSVMTHVRCRHLPVLAEGKVVGLISIGDLVREVSKDQAHELHMIREYVGGKYPG